MVYEETPSYTLGKLIADIGGTLGLILGLNILEILVFVVKATKIVQGKIFFKDKVENSKRSSFGVQEMFEIVKKEYRVNNKTLSYFNQKNLNLNNLT